MFGGVTVGATPTPRVRLAPLWVPMRTPLPEVPLKRAWRDSWGRGQSGLHPECKMQRRTPPPPKQENGQVPNGSVGSKFLSKRGK